MPQTQFRTTPADQPPAPALAGEVREILHGGGLVALATETVYGIAARADLPSALERLTQLKGRSETQTFTWHVASHAVLAHFPELRQLSRRLSQRYWPGPLTLVLRGSTPAVLAITRDGWTGLRMPAHAATRALIAACPFPLVLSSANRSTEPPLCDAPAVAKAFSGQIELVVDGGRARIGESSAVLRLGKGHFQVLREGLITASDLRRAAGLSIGFVCTGNTCRSPMAQGLAGAMLAERLGVGPGEFSTFGFQLSSAGLAASNGAPAAVHAQEILAEKEIDLSGHRSSPATPTWLAGLDHIYGLTQSHVDVLAQHLTPSRAKLAELLDPQGADIPDPIGGSMADYRACAARIRSALAQRLDEWVG